MKPLCKLSPSFDPYSLCKQGSQYQGSIAVAKFTRVCEALASLEGEANVTLHFQTDSEKRSIINIRVESQVQLTCQRCNEAYDACLNSESRLCVVASESQADDLPDQYEPLVANEGLINLNDMVEEELLLALPMIAKHENSKCPKDLSEFIH